MARLPRYCRGTDPGGLVGRNRVLAGPQAERRGDEESAGKIQLFHGYDSTSLRVMAPPEGDGSDGAMTAEDAVRRTRPPGDV